MIHGPYNIKLTGNSLALGITNLYRNTNNPVWVFVVYQTNRFNNQQKDKNTFDYANVGNLWVETGGRRYSEESLDMDWGNRVLLIGLYHAFRDYKRICIKTDSNPSISKKKNFLIYTQFTASMYQFNLKKYLI
jgi:hypothetical protein